MTNFINLQITQRYGLENDFIYSLIKTIIIMKNASVMQNRFILQYSLSKYFCVFSGSNVNGHHKLTLFARTTSSLKVIGTIYHFP